jgi:hypothetical protein
MVFVEQRFGAAFLGTVVAVFDQQPIGALAAEFVAAHAHQHPAAMKLPAFEREFQIA